MIFRTKSSENLRLTVNSVLKQPLGQIMTEFPLILCARLRNHIWELNLTPKVKFFALKLIRGWILTREKI